MSDQPFMQLYVADYLADTLDLSTVEHGAYLLLLMTMWRHDARLPHDTAKLARIARMTPKKFAPVWAEISRFFTVDGDTISNRRLTKEHQKAKEKSEVRATAGRAGGKAKALKENERTLANASDLPWQGQKSESDIDDDEDSARAIEADQTLRERILTAIGADPKTGLTGPNGNILGTRHDMEEVGRWQADLGLTESQIIAVVTETMAKKRDGPPSRFSYFEKSMRQEAGRKSSPKLTPIEGGQDVQPTRTNRQAAASDALRDALHVAGTMRRPSSKDCF